MAKVKKSRETILTTQLYAEDIASGVREMWFMNFRDFLEREADRIIALCIDADDNFVAIVETDNPTISDTVIFSSMKHWLGRMNLIYDKEIPSRHALSQVMEKFVDDHIEGFFRFSNLMPKPKEAILYLNSKRFTNDGFSLKLDITNFTVPTFVMKLSKDGRGSVNFVRTFPENNILPFYETLVYLQNHKFTIPFVV